MVNMKGFLLLLALGCASQATLAQGGGGYEIAGVLADSLSGAPDAYSTVRLLPRNGRQAVAVAASDGQGRFTLRYGVAGEYVVQAMGLGRSTLSRTVTLGGT